jgi:uroporphyrinogen decarboxylase
MYGENKMTSFLSGRENVERTIDFAGPSHLSVHPSLTLDWLHERDGAKLERIQELRASSADDIMEIDPVMNRTQLSEQDGALRWTDEWGTGWANDGHGQKPYLYPLQSGYEDRQVYRLPDPYAPGRFDPFADRLAERGGRYLLGRVWFTLFERLWMLRTFENMLVDPYVEPDAFASLRDAVVEFNLGVIDQWLDRGADGIFFSDDWGTQRGLLIAPDDWRTYYRSSYARMFQRVRQRGAHVWMHLCGNITSILPDLIDLGLNVLNPVQPQAMDVEYLAREYGGKVCFFGGVDVQGTMVRGTPAQVKVDVRRLVKLLGSFSGGYIGGTSHSIMPETPLDNVIALYEAFSEHGRNDQTR